MKRVLAALIVVHRYLGLAFCLIFVLWFASGIVMVYKRMPVYSADERLARLPPLDPSAIRLTPAEALAAAGMEIGPRRVLLTSFRARPVYRFIVEAGSLSVYADDGGFVETVEPAAAVAVAGDVFPESRGTARHVASLTQPDQWTIGNPFRTTGTLHKIALGDEAATEVYVAEATGEMVMKTDRSSRFWGYLGPVTHWFYFTPLRLRGPLWNNLVVYGSAVGCVLCVLGLVIGVYRFSISRRYARGTSVSPYAGWLRWHHYAGLLFGAVTLTWTFSGLLTMTPWNLFPEAGPSAAQVRAIRGDGVDASRFRLTPAAALGVFLTRFPPKELELLQFMGAPFYAAYERPDIAGRAHQDATRFAPSGEGPVRVLVSAGGEAPGIREAFTRDELLGAARAAMAGAGAAPTEIDWLTQFDAYYYDRTGGRRLPALRVKFDDPDGTWLYLDATDGSLVQAEVRGSRVERWLYQGLHSLDFPWLYGMPWAWYVVIVGLSLGGLALSATSVVVAWRVLRGKVRPAAAPAALT